MLVGVISASLPLTVITLVWLFFTLRFSSYLTFSPVLTAWLFMLLYIAAPSGLGGSIGGSLRGRRISVTQ
jgi:hypothetical protein